MSAPINSSSSAMQKYEYVESVSSTTSTSLQLPTAGSSSDVNASNVIDESTLLAEQAAQALNASNSNASSDNSSDSSRQQSNQRRLRNLNTRI